jgi:hypothetical protein
MEKITVELDYDTVDGIIRKELYNAYQFLRNDLELRCAGKGMAIFDIDKEKDIQEITDHLYCFEKVLAYWGYEI